MMRWFAACELFVPPALSLKPSPPFQTIGTKPIAHIDHFTAEMLGTAELAEEVSLEGSGKLVKVRLRLPFAALRPAKALGPLTDLLVVILCRSPAAPVPGRL